MSSQMGHVTCVTRLVRTWLMFAGWDLYDTVGLSHDIS